MKKALASIYFVYAGVLFFLCLTCMLIIYVPLQLIRNDRTRMKIIYFFNKLFLKWIWSSLVFIWVKVEGREKIDDDKTYAFVCNHSNMLDIPFTASCIDHYYKPLVKKELLSFPILGALLKMTSLGVDRSSPESRKNIAFKMAEVMKGGLSLLIFPEGTRNRSPEPTKEFYDGAFKAAIVAHAYIAPIALINVRHLQPVDSKLIYPGRITMRFLDPVSTAGMTEADTDSLKNKVRAMIDDVLRQEDVMYKKIPAAEQ
jgi:1-acyl-sn-glycerol-3-phosphate acyltransferase